MAWVVAYLTAMVLLEPTTLDRLQSHAFLILNTALWDSGEVIRLIVRRTILLMAMTLLSMPFILQSCDVKTDVVELAKKRCELCNGVCGCDPDDSGSGITIEDWIPGDTLSITITPDI